VGKGSDRAVYFLKPDADKPTPLAVIRDRRVEETVQPVSSRSIATDEVTPSKAGRGEHAEPVLRVHDSPFLPEHFVVLDLETTGLSPEADEIIEIGAIRINRDQTNHASFSTLVKPEKRIPKGITEITGITQGMINENGISLAEALSGFTEFIGDLPLVTFNADFDMGFLWNAAKRQGLAIENRHACALRLARRAWPELPSHRLVDLAKIGNLSDDDTHRALGDCKRALIVFASAVGEIGEEIRWSHRQRDWREYVKYHAARDPNRAFVTETRPLEVSDPAQAVIRYNEAMSRMYEYEKLIGGRTGDDHILDRLTLCLWRLGRYQELIDCVGCFTCRFPEARSSVMAGILRRKEKAACKVLPIDRG
jgi:DNA polymerase III epsilon subunit family exonuclease